MSTINCAPIFAGYALVSLMVGSAMAQVNPAMPTTAQPTTHATEKRGMTVDELIESGRLSRNPQAQRAKTFDLPVGAPMPGVDSVVMQPVSPNIPRKTEATPAPLSSNNLSAIYISSTSSKASFQFNGVPKIYVPGDFIPGKWKVLSISQNGVDLERCVKSKCTNKFLFLNE